MRKRVPGMKALILAMLLLLTGCAGRTSAPAVSPTPTPAPVPAGPTALWTREDTPVRVEYQRMWIYSAYAETEDPEAVAALAGAVRALRPGAADDTVTTDYTDILIFHFADGETLTLEFENQNYVAPDDTRYHTEGLKDLRGVLDGMFGEELEQ